MIKKNKSKSPYTVSFKTILDFNKACDKRDINLLNPMTEYLIENYRTKKPIHKVLTVEVDKNKFNVRLKKELFKPTLQDFLNIYLVNENYEMCNKISKTIENE